MLRLTFRVWWRPTALLLPHLLPQMVTQPPKLTFRLMSAFDPKQTLAACQRSTHCGHSPSPDTSSRHATRTITSRAARQGYAREAL